MVSRLRGLFVIDPEGILRYKVVHDLNVGRSAEETLRVIQALQTGGLCQAEWKPGQKTLEFIRNSFGFGFSFGFWISSFEARTRNA